MIAEGTNEAVEVATWAIALCVRAGRLFCWLFWSCGDSPWRSKRILLHQPDDQPFFSHQARRRSQLSDLLVYSSHGQSGASGDGRKRQQRQRKQAWKGTGCMDWQVDWPQRGGKSSCPRQACVLQSFQQKSWFFISKVNLQSFYE